MFLTLSFPETVSFLELHNILCLCNVYIHAHTESKQFSVRFFIRYDRHMRLMSIYTVISSRRAQHIKPHSAHRHRRSISLHNSPVLPDTCASRKSIAQACCQACALHDIAAARARHFIGQCPRIPYDTPPRTSQFRIKVYERCSEGTSDFDLPGPLACAHSSRHIGVGEFKIQSESSSLKVSGRCFRNLTSVLILSRKHWRPAGTKRRRRKVDNDVAMNRCCFEKTRVFRVGDAYVRGWTGSSRPRVIMISTNRDVVVVLERSCMSQ